MDTDTQTFRHLQQENIRLRSENNSLKSYVERLQRAIRALVNLQHKLEKINSTTDVFQLVHEILQNALDAVDSDDGSLMLLDDESGDLVFVEVVGNTRDKLLNFRLPKGQGIAHWVVSKRQSRLVEDTRREPVFSPQVDKISSMNNISLICVPLLDGSRTLGTIEVVNSRSGRPFNEADKEIMELVGQLSALAIVTAEKSQKA